MSTSSAQADIVRRRKPPIVIDDSTKFDGNYYTRSGRAVRKSVCFGENVVQ